MGMGLIIKKELKLKIEEDSALFDGGLYDFLIDEDRIGYDNQLNVYYVYRTTKNYHTSLGTYGSITVLMSKNSEDHVCLSYPLLSPPQTYSIIEKSELKKYSELYSKLSD